MSALPEGWGIAPLTDVAQVVRGVTYKKEAARLTPAAGFLPLLRATNIRDQLDLDGELVYVPAAGVKDVQRLRRGDVLLVASSGSASVVGKSASLTSDWSGTFGAFCSVLRPGPAVHPRYLAMFVQSAEVRRRWSDAARGTNINNLKASALSETLVPLPPLGEQRRIAHALDGHLSRLDAAAGALDRAQLAQQALRVALLRTAFAGGLPLERVDREPEVEDYV